MSKTTRFTEPPKPRAAAPPQPPAVITIQDAVMRLNKRLMDLELRLETNLKQMETKFGEQDSFLSNNTPDLDLINQAFSDINARLLDCEGLETRVAALEGTDPQVSSPVPSVAPSKKSRGTVKVDVEQPGITFKVN